MENLDKAKIKSLLSDYEVDDSIWSIERGTRGDKAKRIFRSLSKSDKILLLLHMEYGTKRMAQMLNISPTLCLTTVKDIKQKFREKYTRLYGDA